MKKSGLTAANTRFAKAADKLVTYKDKVLQHNSERRIRV